MATVYTLHSETIDRFYIGSCKNMEERLLEHQINKYKTGFTHRANDWIIFFQIPDLEYQQA